MNIQEYISSGILESYVLGLATAEESAKVKEMAEQHPEIRAEIERVERDLVADAEAGVHPLPAFIKDNIFNEIEGMESPEAKVVAFDTTEPVADSGRLRFLIAASVALLVLSMVANFYLFRQWTNISSQLAEVRAQNEILADQMEVQQAAFVNAQHDLAIMMEPGMKSVMLKGLDPAPEAMAMVYYNDKNQDVFLHVRSLPSPDPDKQYQLWAIVDGKPVDAGVFDMVDAGPNLLRMRNISKAKAFAVTLERMGGSPVPSMDAMYLMGEV